MSQPGWKSMWTSTIGKARASTQAPADARGKATPRSPPKDVRAATGGHYSGRPDADAPSVAALRYGARPLRKRCTRVPGKHRGSAPARPGRVRPLHAGDLRRRLLPGPARPDRGGGDDQVRLPLHDHRPLGAAPAALPPRDGPEDARRPARGDRAGDPCAVRGHAVQRERVAHPVPARRAAAAVVHPRGAGRRRARPDRTVRRPGRLHAPDAAPARDRSRRRRRATASPRP